MLKEKLKNIKQGLYETEMLMGLDLKHVMTNEWHQLKTNGSVNLLIYRSRMPYMVQRSDAVELESAMFVAKVKDNPASFEVIRIVVTSFVRLNKLKLCTPNLQPYLSANHRIRRFHYRICGFSIIKQTYQSAKNCFR